MVKIKTKFYCRECGHENPRWLGRCPACGEWNSFIEERVEKKVLQTKTKPSEVLSIAKISSAQQERIDTGSVEINRVLGGGVVPGSFVLLSGEPGIGKSTLLLQLADLLAKKNPVLYVSGEESANQIKLRADRLGISSENLHVMSETSIQKVKDITEQNEYKIVFIDSIQTMILEELQSAAGSVTQVREGSAFLMRMAKENEISVFIVGHVTKDGSIAGPRVLEHMVDTVLYFEGDQHHIYRLLRAVKNRFGSTNEIGVFEMRGSGLVEVANPSLVFMGSSNEPLPGSAVTVVMEGTRPLLVEIQALVSNNAYPPPRRTVNGLDYHRLLMFLAVMEKRTECTFYNKDVFVNIAGGIKVDDPSIDLGVIAAILSGLKDRAHPHLAIIGEIGLTGEIRGVSQIEQRVNEAEKFGFEGCVIPYINANRVETAKIKIYPVKRLEDVVNLLSK
ncbi:MAG: DNA repair protein RadA [Eubacteriales bacterium]